MHYSLRLPLFALVGLCLLPKLASADTQAPALAITAPKASLIAFTATFTFSESVTGFTLGDITVANGTASNLSGSGARYTATITPNGKGNTTIDVPANAAKDLAGNGSLAARRIMITYADATAVGTRTTRVISNYMARRGNQVLAAEPDLSERFKKTGANNDSGRPLDVTGSGDDTRLTMEFATSLQTIAEASLKKNEEERKEAINKLKERDQEKAKLPAPVTINTDFDVWTEAKIVHVAGSQSSDLRLLYMGSEYRVKPQLLVGVLGQFDWSEENGKDDDANVRGAGWMFGPYVVAKLDDHLLFDGRAAWGLSENAVAPLGTYSDEFESARWLISGRLSGDFNHEDWTLSPQLGVLNFQDREHAYTDRLSIDIPSDTVSLGQVTFGPKVKHSSSMKDGTKIVSHATVSGIWTFDQDDLVNIDSGLPQNQIDELRARANTGFTAEFDNGWSLSGEGFYDGIGVDNYEAYGGSVGLTIPLHQANKNKPQQ